MDRRRFLTIAGAAAATAVAAPLVAKVLPPMKRLLMKGEIGWIPNVVIRSSNPTQAMIEDVVRYSTPQLNPVNNADDYYVLVLTNDRLDVKILRGDDMRYQPPAGSLRWAE